MTSERSTNLPTIDADAWAVRILDVFPEAWSNSASRNPGGEIYALMKAVGEELDIFNKNLQYVLDASRISTATDEALDRVAQDYYGPTAVAKQEIIRAPGEDDDTFRARIKASLLLPLGTRAAIIELITRLTGQAPRVMEPWNLNDTAAWDAFSYWDIDTVDNPSRYADPSLRGQGFVESPLPNFQGDGIPNPLWCYDEGACYDTFSAYWLDASSTWFLNIKKLDDLLNKTKVFVTRIWRRYLSQPLTSWALGGSKGVVEDALFTEIEVFPQFANTFSVIASANWNTSIDVDYISNSKFRLTFGTPPPPGGGSVDWLAAPVTVPGFATIPMNIGQTEMDITVVPELLGRNLFVSPNWNSSFWMTATDVENKSVEFDVPAPNFGQVSTVLIAQDKSGFESVEPGTVETIVNLDAKTPYQAFVIPSWNTICEIDKSDDHITVKYSTPPTEAGIIFWGFHDV